MIRSHGLSHIQIRVKDVERSARFYEAVAGVRVRDRDEYGAVLVTPGAHDIFTLAHDPEPKEPLGAMGAIAHFGFRLQDRESFAEALAAVEKNGGKVLKHGERGDENHPWAFVADPDGYKVEVFFE